MKKFAAFLIMGLMCASLAHAQEFYIPRDCNHGIVNVDANVSEQTWSQNSVLITITNYHATLDLYVTLDGSVPNGTSNCYIIGPSFERTWWIKRRSVKLKGEGDMTGAVGVEVCY